MSVINPKNVEARTKKDLYLEALEAIGDWVTVSEWAVKFGEMFPDVLADADRQARHHAVPSTGLLQIAARISSNLAAGNFGTKVEIDGTEKPRKVRLLTSTEALKHLEQDIEEDAEPLRRDIEARDRKLLSKNERYRYDELRLIAKQLTDHLGFGFHVDHADALMNPKSPGKNHPDNLQILSRVHNVMKSSANWQRFTFAEQKEYILAAVQMQKLVSKKMDIELDDSTIARILERLKIVF